MALRDEHRTGALLVVSNSLCALGQVTAVLSLSFLISGIKGVEFDDL